MITPYNVKTYAKVYGNEITSVFLNVMFRIEEQRQAVYFN